VCLGDTVRKPETVRRPERPGYADGRRFSRLVE
jgi:hypothetical protein